MLTHYMRTGTRLFEYERLTYTHCQEHFRDDRFVVGNFSEEYLRVFSKCDDEFVGIAGMLKL